MGLLTDAAINYYDLIVLEEIVPNLIGTQVIAKSPEIPVGAQQVTRDQIAKLKGKAKTGKKGQPIPRETGDVSRKTVLIPEISHGFTLHRKDIQSSKRAGTPLPDAAARQSSRLVLEGIEDLIFNGNPALKIKGIYEDAGDTYTVEDGYEWNADTAQPFNNMIAAMGQLNSTGKYTGKKLVLSPLAYWSAHKTNSLGISYFDQIAGLFPNGKADIFQAPPTANGEVDGTTIIPQTGGLLCDFGNSVAERYEEEAVNLQQDFAMDENNLFPFNVLTYQSLDIHRLEAFLKLDNLIDLDLLTP
jgi:uncharacterized linocin/CFP29 family protein